MPDEGVGLRTVKALTSAGRDTPGPHVTPATQGSGFNQVVPESCFALKERKSPSSYKRNKKKEVLH